jgi:hypothetical protein
VAAALLLGGLGQGVAGAAPTPSYSVSCVVGGLTTADWQRVRVSQVLFEWLAPAGSGIVFDPATVPVTAKAHHGSAFSTTEWSGDVNAANVVVTFTNADGTTSQLEAACK